MTDPIPLNGRLTEILRGLPSPIAAEAFEPGYYRSCVTWEELVEKLAPIVAQAAEEHYRPRVETVEQLDALPVGSVVADSYPDAMTKLNDGWYCCSGGGRRQRYELPARLLWSPGAGE